LSEDATPKVALPAGLVYPCEFPLKLFIKPDLATEQRLIELTRSQLDAGAILETSRRSSSNGKYLSLTINFVAQDAVHLQRVIDTVCKDPGVVLAL
jgi:putative lipoic acid-binding regulatory protein